jgi:hypothetical protein
MISASQVRDNAKESSIKFGKRGARHGNQEGLIWLESWIAG